MRRLYWLLLLFPFRAMALGYDPFTVEARLDSSGPEPLVRVSATVPPNHILYAHEFKISSDDAKLIAVDVPKSVTILDKFTDEMKEVYDSDVEFTFKIGDPKPAALSINVAYQGCDDSMCFFPQNRKFSLALAAGAVPEKVLPQGAGQATIGKTAVESLPAIGGAGGGQGSNDWKNALETFSMAGTAAGYLNRQQFLDFLGGGHDSAMADFERRGLWVTMLLLLLGGVALNLTPCVLPLIPINLAILGAGAHARTKGQGFLLGALYGLAMAVVYGALGVLVVFTGAKFGALNASLGFNVAIAVLFLVLALGMFDVIAIDLSRFQGRASTEGKTGLARYAAAFAMGAVAALLAGACVAPVVISTLLLSGNLYAQGHRVAALLPFLLGLGMGLPWPFAGAGLSFLPKPGKWMTRVKNVFGVAILALALYYGKLGLDIYRLQSAGGQGGDDPAVASTKRLVDALKGNKPVFIDFWATWCKNCHAMDATTFRDAQVRERLKDFTVVKYQAEFPEKSPAKEVLDHFKAVGLPTYVVLQPRNP